MYTLKNATFFFLLFIPTLDSDISYLITYTCIYFVGLKYVQIVVVYVVLYSGSYMTHTCITEFKIILS